MIKQNKNNILSAFLLAVGLIVGAWVLGSQFKNLRQTGEITVKGVAEGVYKSEIAHWRIGVEGRAPTYADAVEKSRQDLPMVKEFLHKHGFTEADYTVYRLNIEDYYEDHYDRNNRYQRVKNGYTYSQNIGIQTKDLDKLKRATKEIVDFRARFSTLTFHDPKYYLTNLEAIKQSMIAKATQDAHYRAEEFAKTGNAHVGAMKSASQGAFNIMANTFDQNESDSYGGRYDTGTVYKRVRLVVTIRYNIQE